LLFLRSPAASTEQLFHWSSYSLAALAPVALILSPSFLNFPVDFALGLIIPVHMHIGLVGVVEDYVPRKQQHLVRFLLAIASVLSAIGLLKINLCGAGITESVKCVWREPKQQEKVLYEQPKAKPTY
jgi:succinate dehydrogenase (ubiquinone) membrane anchor subunit